MTKLRTINRRFRLLPMKAKTLLQSLRTAAAQALADTAGGGDWLEMFLKIALGFIVFALITALLIAAINGPLSTWWNNTINSWFPAGGTPRP